MGIKEMFSPSPATAVDALRAAQSKLAEIDTEIAKVNADLAALISSAEEFAANGDESELARSQAEARVARERLEVLRLARAGTLKKVAACKAEQVRAGNERYMRTLKKFARQREADAEGIEHAIAELWKRWCSLHETSERLAASWPSGSMPIGGSLASPMELVPALSLELYRHSGAAPLSRPKAPKLPGSWCGAFEAGQPERLTPFAKKIKAADAALVQSLAGKFEFVPAPEIAPEIALDDPEPAPSIEVPETPPQAPKVTAAQVTAMLRRPPVRLGEGLSDPKPATQE